MLDRKSYMKEYNKKYYKEHREHLIEYATKYHKDNSIKQTKQMKERRKGVRQFIQEYKIEKGCYICGYNKCADALEFHHLENKDFCISNAIRNNRGVEAVKEEIKKCIVLCANCHRELHAKEKKTW